jgi:hypothetical protein
VADVEQRVHQPAVGVVDKDDIWFVHNGWIAISDIKSINGRKLRVPTTPVMKLRSNTHYEQWNRRACPSMP